MSKREEADMSGRGFLDRIPSFSLILIMVVLMTVGAALTPLLKLSYKPSAKQGDKLSITSTWQGASARIIEQEVVSRIEGAVSTIAGIESISSRSSEGSGRITITLKEGVDISTKRFEISSIIKQIAELLPEEASYPQVEGGNVNETQNRGTLLLSYIINGDLPLDVISERVSEVIEPSITEIEGVKEFVLTGASPSYLDIEYDPFILESYGVEANDILTAIVNFLGRSNIIGDVDRVSTSGVKERISMVLQTRQGDDLGEIPITNIDGKMIYLRDISHISSKVRNADTYFRIDGLNTINISIMAQADVNVIALSDRVQRVMAEVTTYLDEGLNITLATDAAEEIKVELYKLVRRTLLSLFILLIFVFIASRSGRYLSIIALTLAANILIAVLFYYLLGIELHLFSLAGIAVSFGIIIDTSIVMVDHYNYYRNRGVFIAIWRLCSPQ